MLGICCVSRYGNVIQPGIYDPTLLSSSHALGSTHVSGDHAQQGLYYGSSTGTKLEPAAGGTFLTWGQHPPAVQHRSSADYGTFVNQTV